MARATCGMAAESGSAAGPGYRRGPGPPSWPARAPGGMRVNHAARRHRDTARDARRATHPRPHAGRARHPAMRPRPTPGSRPGKRDAKALAINGGGAQAAHLRAACRRVRRHSTPARTRAPAPGDMTLPRRGRPVGKARPPRRNGDDTPLPVRRTERSGARAPTELGGNRLARLGQPADARMAGRGAGHMAPLAPLSALGRSAWIRLPPPGAGPDARASPARSPGRAAPR